MSWESLDRLEAWMQEMWWKLQKSEYAPQTISWQLPTEHLQKTILYTPTSYQWQPSRTWIEPIRQGAERFVPVKLKEPIVEDPGHHLVLLELEYDGTLYPIAVDYYDKNDISEEWAQRCLVYFKMQFHEDGYAFPNVVPGGFVVREERIYDYLLHLRRIREMHEARYEVYGRFGADFAQEVRQRALEILKNQSRFQFEGSMKLIRYSRYLQETALAEICIDLPGNGDFCFRLIDYFAVGACVIGPRHRNRMHVPLQDRKHIVYTKDDFSDLVELCSYYLEHEEERLEICEASCDFFDKYLHRDQLAAYYLHSIYQFLP